MNPARLRALVDDLHEVVERHRRAAEAAPAVEACQVQLFRDDNPRADPS